MRIKIVENPVVTGAGNDKFRKMMQAVAGQWLEVETDYLFQNQFNTPPIPGVSENGLRVMAGNVAEIENDARLGRVFDAYTHKNYKSKNSLPKKVRNRPDFKKWIQKFKKHPHGSDIALMLVPAYKGFRL